MKQQLVYKFFISLFFVAAYSNAQKQTKTFNENFNVVDNAVLNINTTHTDIEFETWNKNQVAIEVVIEIEGASSKEIDAYFKKNEVKITGNSKQIDISTGIENIWSFNTNSNENFITSWNVQDFNIPEITAIPDIEYLAFVTDSINLPPTPPMPIPHFDYDAFKKDGDVYLKKWQEKFEKNFGGDYEKKMEAWQAKAELASKAHEKAREAQEKARVIVYEKANEARVAAMQDKQQVLKEQLRKNAEVRKEQLYLRKGKGDTLRIDTLRRYYSTSPNVYYFSSDKKGATEKVKVKKYIKIKMPKSATLKMNVRHGEVKLAENTKNINATLAYSGLFAATIDGDKTQINASYSPVSVERWNYGKLKVSYADNVKLSQVNHITLSSTSSDVTIDNLLKNIYVENNFGALKIKAINTDFSAIDVSMKNGELICNLPETPFNILVNGENSKLTAPSSLTLTKTKNDNTVLCKGFNVSKSADKSITINSKYSDVVLE
tara:strand:+ start:56653 stop:58125 length:1473 start_codon:yes stop_codon:yes gene_type:complete